MLSKCLWLRLRCRQLSSTSLLWRQCQHSGRRPSTCVGSSFSTALLVSPHCIVVLPVQLCLCQDILPACLYWSETAHRKTLNQPDEDLCICSVVLPSLPKPCVPIFSLVIALVITHLAVSKKLLLGGRCKISFELDQLDQLTDQLTDPASCTAVPLMLTQRRRRYTQQDPGLSLA